MRRETRPGYANRLRTSRITCQRRAARRRTTAQDWGRLKAIVATGTLELGIDIGTIDEVILIQAPHSIASAIQRIGRAGHNVGDTSRATLVATHARDLLEMTVVGKAVLAEDLEAIAPIEQPLDVLTQVILSMTVKMTWSVDRIFDEGMKNFV